MKSLPLSLQLWSLRDDYKVNYAKTIQAVAQMGFQGVELPLDFGDVTEAAAQKLVAEAGLTVSGLHVGIDALRSNIPGLIASARLFDTRHVICPWMPPETYATRAQCEAFGEELNTIGKALHAAGIQFSFHNHGQEFQVVEGRYALEWVLDATEPRYVTVEPDVYWIAYAKACPVQFLRRAGARAKLIHLKDGADGRQTELGRGQVDFAGILQAVDEIGVAEWLILEQEEYNFAPLESIRLGLEKLRTLV